MNLEWLYSNLTWIIIVLVVATIILFLFPVILGAFSLTFFNYFESISFNISSVILDIIFSFIISYFAIKIFYKFSSARGFRFFGVYRIILSIFLLIYYF